MVVYDTTMPNYLAYITMYTEAKERKEYALIAKDNRKIIYLYYRFQRRLLESEIDSKYYAREPNNVRKSSRMRNIR